VPQSEVDEGAGTGAVTASGETEEGPGEPATTQQAAGPPVERAVDPSAGQETRPAPAAAGRSEPESPAVGYLTVNAQPVFAFVEVDGIELPNSTPIFEHPLSPGTHIVTVRREGYQTIVDTVQISVGNVTRRNHVMIRN
jgi:hypothetical protein